MANAILEHVHQVIAGMLCMSQLDMADSITNEDVQDFIANTLRAIRTKLHTVLKASPGQTIFRRGMASEIPFLTNWSKIGEYR